MKSKQFCWAAGLCFYLLVISQSFASTVTYYFGGVVTSAGDSCGVASCDSALLGSGPSAVSTRFSGQYTFDNAWSPEHSSASEATYASTNNSPTFGMSITLGGVNFSIGGLFIEVRQPESGGNGTYQVAVSSALKDSGYAGGQPLAAAYWTLTLESDDFWGDGTTNIPATPPLLSDFEIYRSFILGVYSHYDANLGDTSRQYDGYIDYLSDAPAATTPLPTALPLFVTGLGALGLLGWRRKRKAAALAT